MTDQITPARYRKKPAEIEAVQLTWQTWNEVCEFIGEFPAGMRGVYVDAIGNPCDDYPGPQPGAMEARIGLVIPTPEGAMLAVQDDWIIRDVEGELYPCKPNIFAKTYEAAASAAVPAPADRAGLRDRIAEVLHQDQTPPPTVPWSDEAPMDREFFLRRADAVLAVLPGPADRATVLRETADRFERDPHTIQMFGHQVAALLRRMADETASSAPSGPRPTTTGAERAKVLSEIIGRITGAPTEDSITEDAPATLVLAVLEDLLAEQHSTAAAQPAGGES